MLIRMVRIYHGMMHLTCRRMNDLSDMATFHMHACNDRIFEVRSIWEEENDHFGV